MSYRDDYCDELREKFDSFPFNQDVEQGPMSFHTNQSQLTS